MPEDVTALIEKDHREFERLFEMLRTDPSSRPGQTPVLTTLLFAHSRAEEAEVYPVARDEAGAIEDVEHSQKEHLEADQLLADLAACDLDSPDYEQTLDKVVESVTHHLQEEEKTVLPRMREGLTAERLAEPGTAFAKVRAENLGEQPADVTKADLEQQAANIDLPGASGMPKDELAEQLKQRAEH